MGSVGLVLLLAAWALANVDPKKGRVTTNPPAGRYTLEQEVQIGQQAVAEIERQLPLLPPNHPMSKYISWLGQCLADHAPGYRFPYTFKVVRENSVNAFALPGGPIYVHTGLIEAASEAELAGVMGHEISHVVMRHSTRQASRQMKAQLPLAILGGVLGAGVGGWAGSLAQMGMSVTAGSVFMKYSRDAETEADMVGAQTIYDTGYDPQAVVSFFRKLQQQTSGNRGPQFLSSHPDPGNRAQEIARILSRFPAKKYQESDSAEFVEAKKALADVNAAAPAPARESVAIARLPLRDIASPNFKTFQHSAYTIQYPATWLMEHNASSTVTVHPAGGLAKGSLAYGAVISGFQPKPQSRKELDDAVRELMTDVEQSNHGLRVYNGPQAMTVAGLSARRVEWTGESPVRENGQALQERVRMIAVAGKAGVILYMVFVAPEPDFEGMWPVFQRMLNSFQVR